MSGRNGLQRQGACILQLYGAAFDQACGLLSAMGGARVARRALQVSSSCQRLCACPRSLQVTGAACKQRAAPFLQSEALLGGCTRAPGRLHGLERSSVAGHGVVHHANNAPAQSSADADVQSVLRPSRGQTLGPAFCKMVAVAKGALCQASRGSRRVVRTSLPSIRTFTRAQRAKARYPMDWLDRGLRADAQ